MPKPYILKNDMTSDAKVQRILKTIEDNAKADRKKALSLVKKAENTLQEIANNIEVSERTGTSVADAYTGVFNTIILALNQAGIANERLIKLATVIQKFIHGKGKSSEPGMGSLFTELARQSKAKPEQDDD